jgi:hypothetical protein
MSAAEQIQAEQELPKGIRQPRHVSRRRLLDAELLAEVRVDLIGAAALNTTVCFAFRASTRS